MTGLLDRLDGKVSTASARWDRLEAAGWACVVGGGFTAVVAGGVVGALYFWGDLLTVKDFL